jgi:hypothetical protein
MGMKSAQINEYGGSEVIKIKAHLNQLHLLEKF